MLVSLSIPIECFSLRPVQPARSVIRSFTNHGETSIAILNQLPSRCVMVYLLAFGLFLFLSAACWYVATVLFQSAVTTAHPDETPEHASIVRTTIIFAALTCFVPGHLGTLLRMIVWGQYVAKLTMSFPHKYLLFAFLVVTSFVERLATLGVLELIK
jgi:hypothetical protein